jgi:hypothetical protein
MNPVTMPNHGYRHGDRDHLALSPPSRPLRTIASLVAHVANLDATTRAAPSPSECVQLG